MAGKIKVTDNAIKGVRLLPLFKTPGLTGSY